MKNEATASAQTAPKYAWDGWSDQMKVEWLAMEVMGWRKEVVEAWGNEFFAWFDRNKIQYQCTKDGIPFWDPLTSWDNWRSVEMKVMEDERLWGEYRSIFQKSDEYVSGLAPYMKADLPTRSKALFLAYHSLHD